MFSDKDTEIKNEISGFSEKFFSISIFLNDLKQERSISFVSDKDTEDLTCISAFLKKIFIRIKKSMDQGNLFLYQWCIAKTKKITIKIPEKGSDHSVLLIEPIQNNLVQEEMPYDVD